MPIKLTSARIRPRGALRPSRRPLRQRAETASSGAKSSGERGWGEGCGGSAPAGSLAVSPRSLAAVAVLASVSPSTPAAS